MQIPDPRRGPRPGGEQRLYALLAVELEPGKIAYYHLELDHAPGACTIDMERPEPEQVYIDYDKPLRSLDLEPWHITATLSGTVVSDRPDYRPPTRADATIGDNALTGYTRPVPALPAAPDDDMWGYHGD